MSNCLFCKMVLGEIEADKVYETDTVLAFNDINPQAPTHILVIPKEHKSSIVDFTRKDGTLLVDLFEAVNQIAKKNQLDQRGFRVVTNTGSEAGQSVDHIHFHLLGGRVMHWPPG